jgi:PAT family acetyl-CoA transporter-like MFS transporter 1
MFIYRNRNKTTLVEYEKLIKQKDIKTFTNSNQSDVFNILLLMFLYVLQGIPLGLTQSLPFILSSRNSSYSDQAIFSLAAWPFSLKLLWAPIVDSLYWKRLGRRKSWLVPTQYLIGIKFSYFLKFNCLTMKKNFEFNSDK